MTAPRLRVTRLAGHRPKSASAVRISTPPAPDAEPAAGYADPTEVAALADELEALEAWAEQVEP